MDQNKSSQYDWDYTVRYISTSVETEKGVISQSQQNEKGFKWKLKWILKGE